MNKQEQCNVRRTSGVAPALEEVVGRRRLFGRPVNERRPINFLQLDEELVAVATVHPNQYHLDAAIP